MVGKTNVRDYFLIILCAGMMCAATPIEAISVHATFHAAFSKFKKFTSLDYLLHCDCKAHQENQTLKNQIRRHPERFGIYLATGTGLLFAAYKLFTASKGNITLEQPTPITPSIQNPEPVQVNQNPIPNQQPANPIVLPVPTAPVDVPPALVEEPTPPVDNTIAPVLNAPIVPVDTPIMYPPIIQNNNHLPTEEPDDAQNVNNEPVQLTQTPEILVLSQENPQLPPKDKEEADENDAINTSFVIIHNNNNSIKDQLSQPFQNLIDLALPDIQDSNMQHDAEELILGAACNHALITNNQEAIDAFAQNHPDSVRALITYYYALAAGKKQFFDEGTFLIAHPRSEAILEFLNRNPLTEQISLQILNTHIKLPVLESIPQAYERISSHFGKFMEYTGKHEQHYGLDIDHLPTGKQTLLFGHVDKDHHMIFIKPESHGTLSIKDIALHGASYAYSVWVKILAALTSGPSHDDDPKFRKERVPVELLRSFNIITQELVNAKSITIEEARQFNKNAQASGIAFMHAITKPAFIAQLTDDQNLIDQCTEFYNAIEKEYDHPMLRFGREVILTEHELKYISQQDFERIVAHFFGNNFKKTT